MVKKVNGTEFENEARKSAAALIDFSATWCGPCRMLAPVLEDLSEKLAGKVDFFNVDVDEVPEIQRQLYSLPRADEERPGSEPERGLPSRRSDQVLDRRKSLIKAIITG